MTAFSKSFLSSKTGECRRLAEHIAAAARQMGLTADLDPSRISASHYVMVCSDEGDDLVKIRCSDHDDRHGGSDWHAWAGECPSATIQQVADHFGRAVPAGYTAADYAARSLAAKTRAATRSAALKDTEADMVAAVIGALEGAKNISSLAAGKAIDALFPAIPRAQRQRMAYSASAALVLDRAESAAEPVPTAVRARPKDGSGPHAPSSRMRCR